MTIGWYIFALYVFALVCAAMLLYKRLFSDGKRQERMLEEKESRLLKLYRDVEEIMDEFYGVAGEVRPRTGDASVNAPEEAAQGFQLSIESFADLPPIQKPEESADSRRAHILAMSEAGDSGAEIARALGITQNEVSLVLGMVRKVSAK